MKERIRFIYPRSKRGVYDCMEGRIRFIYILNLREELSNGMKEE